MLERLISVLEEDVSELLLAPIFYSLDPGKRIYWVYLMSAFLIAVVIFTRRQGSFIQGVKSLLSFPLWLNASSLVDLQWTILNHCLRVLVILPLLGGQVVIALGLNKMLYEALGTGDFLAWEPLAVALFYTVVVFVVDDVTRFIVHYYYHKWPFLWRFHAIHHSASHLTPLTLYRVHTLEMILNSCRSMLVIGGMGGLFLYCFSANVGPIEIMGVGIVNLMFNVTGANLRHSPVWFGYGRLEVLFVSPAQHQIHHSSSEEHFDKNFGSILSVWDRLAGTWCASKNETVSQFGLQGRNHKKTFIEQLFSGI